MRELLGLVQELGHRDFRDARGPMGLTQRQAGGRFTRDEAATLVQRLHDAKAEGTDLPAAAGPVVAPELDDDPLRSVSAVRLARELERRGWTVRAPTP